MMLFKKFGLNPAGRTFACGDIHGEYDLLEEALKKISFNKEKDRLFCLGDLGDRGPKSHLSVEYLGKPWFHSIRGNHEEMAIAYFYGLWPRDNFIRNGGEWFVDLNKDEQAVYVFMYEELPYAAEVETPSGKVGLVHAECYFKDWENLILALTGDDKIKKETMIEYCTWSREFYYSGKTDPVKNIRAVLHGHTIVEKPEVVGNRYYMDTGAYYYHKKKGVNNLSIIDIDHLEFVHGPI
ncbi:serine/threonine protein phosphatase [Ralstonia phage RSP15]|uniref:NinI-like serine-threonine phosphatase n=1 Tax=Ralstonia phage RSP15 TaxID=1785960 RepID=UPI00074D2F1B|nr:NinI-like serine-threonine phosphatase [Ralstonia phage RSP15]BAU40150.1 serine/threonine protein phosphatase [Ralstonia phage RSP15]